MSTTIELAIRGMDCADCARHVEERLHKIDGVQSAQVFLSAEKGVVTYDAARVEPAAFIRAIDELGYRAENLDAAPRANAQRQAVALADTARFVFIALIAVLAIMEMVAERLGLLEDTIEHIPLPLVLLAILVGGFPIFRSAFLGLRARQINADLLMLVAITGASALGEFISAALIIFFMQ